MSISIKWKEDLTLIEYKDGKCGTISSLLASCMLFFPSPIQARVSLVNSSTSHEHYINWE